MAPTMNDLPDRTIYTVSELNAAARHILEGNFPSILIQGELSNFATPASGHWYFTIKDEAAQVRCAMFRGNNRCVPFQPEDGALVLLRARVSVYPRRGDYQLICQSMEPAGEGALRQAYEQLKKKLAGEGLFDDAIKQALPAMPASIGVISSSTGAAVRDILTTLERRWPLARVRIYPTLVQGSQAAPALAGALKRANDDNACDVLIVARGGGSLEDLWAFNDEAVARAIRASAIPVISGVGHETDFTITDFAADLRAPTPTGAAEHAVPDQQDMIQQLDGIDVWLTREIRARIERIQERIGWAARRLEQLHPRVRLHQHATRLQELATRLNTNWAVALTARAQRVTSLHAQLHQHNPRHRVAAMDARYEALGERLRTAIRRNINNAHHRHEVAIRGLDAISPLATLERGYAIVSDTHGRALKTTAGLQKGATIHARLAHGQITANITTTNGTNNK